MNLTNLNISKKGIIQILSVFSTILVFTISMTELFSKENRLYYMLIPVFFSVGLSIYSVINKLANWRIFLLYFLIGLILLIFHLPDS